MEPEQLQNSEVYIKILLSALTVCFAVIGYFLVKTMEELREVKKISIQNSTDILLNTQRDRFVGRTIKNITSRLEKLEEKFNEFIKQ